MSTLPEPAFSSKLAHLGLIPFLLDIRYCSADAWFTIKEVDVGLAADVGTLARFPKIVGNDSITRELAYTARKFDAQEAKEIGFIGRIFPTKEDAVNAAIETAKLIASKSPVGVQGTKNALLYSRDHTVAEGNAYIANWNAFALQTEVSRASSGRFESRTGEEREG